MGCFKFKKVLFGLTTVLAATSLFAQDALVDNCDDGDNENEFGAYWYYYDDNSGVAENDRPTSAPSSEPSVILVDYKDKEITLRSGEKWTMKDYKFECDSTGTNKYANMPFEIGEIWESLEGWEANPFVGMGVMLAQDGKSIDLKDAEKIKFKMKADQALTVVFKVQLKSIDDDSTFAYHQIELAATSDWDDYEVSFAELEQPSWYTDDPVTFTTAEVTKLAWEVPEKSNSGLTEGVLSIDDIYITPYEHIPTDLWTETEDLDDTAGMAAFATFEKSPKNQTPLKTYWYAYDDGEIDGSSKVDEGAEKNETTDRLELGFIAETGSDGEGTAPLLRFTLGDKIPQNDITVAPFVGIGVNVYDSANCKYYDGSKQDYIYFHYKTAGVRKATIEISDINDVPDADNKDRKDTRGSGIVWYRDLPNTDDIWKAVKIPFSELVTHDAWEGYKHIPLDKKNLAKIQFKVQGAPGTEGFLSVDNVYFEVPVPVAKRVSNSVTSPFTASFRNGRINIDWAGKTTLAEGKISLIDARGAVVKSIAVAKANKLSDKLSVNTLASGVYIVKLNGIDASGKSVEMMSSVNVIK